MNTLTISSITAAVLLTVPAIYLAVLSIASLFARKKTQKIDREDLPRIAVVIPAHNEEVLLKSTINHIAKTEYPNELIDVFVIADNCTDTTAKVAAEHGAKVVERFASVEDGRGKPFALKWFFEGYGEQLDACDIISIVDADTEVDSRFFVEIANAMASPDVHAVQGYYGTSNVDAGWRAALSEVALCVSHHLRTLGRNVLGSTAGLKGNGMAFRKDVLLRNGWPAKALDEDLELSLILLEQGVCVHYAPDARIRAEMASDKEGATKQRLRWEGGRAELIYKYGTRLLSMLKTRRAGQAFEALLDLITPPLVPYVASLTLASVVAVVFGQWIAAAITGGFLLCMILMTVQAMVMRGAPRECWLALLEFPKFAIWKLAVTAKLLNPKTKILWLRTTRDHEAAVAAPTVATGAGFSLKRLVDIGGSVAALFVLLPVFAITALFIKLEDGGPVFFKQTRVGENGETFAMWKFRSMSIDAESLRSEVLADNTHAAGVTFKSKSDSRITRAGKFIRKFSVDELPQFVNVLLGNMSLVGPRPPLPSEVAEYRSLELRRLSVKPGLSCLWQIEGRADIDFEGQCRLDLEYIHSASLGKDLGILARTMPAVLSARGAY